MPIYDFVCHDCGKSFSVFLSMNDECKECKHCKSDKISKNIGQFSHNVKSTSNNSKAGDLVKKKIEEFREDLKQEKKRIKEKEYTQKC